MVAYNEENKKKQREALEHNWKVFAKLMKPKMEKIVKDVNKALEQMAILLQYQNK